MICKYLEEIGKIPKKDKYNKSDLFIEPLLMESKGNINVYYAPFDYVNPKGKVMLLGITPGFTQMHNAIKYTVDNLAKEPQDSLIRNAKRFASFSGPLRKNLVTMLDDIGLNTALGINSTDELFHDHFDLVHNTSILRYPVFVKGENYTGSSPKIVKSEFLLSLIEKYFLQELQELNKDILIIPMGKAISDTLIYLQENNKLKNKNIMFNFPHPSGANVNRLKQFNLYKTDFEKIIKQSLIFRK